MQAQDTRPATRLTALYEAHAADVFRFAMHLTGSREDAEDVVQFVFLRAYAALEEGTELMHPRAWLMKAAKHRSLNTIRDRREAPMAESELPLSPRHDPDPSEAAALAAVRSTLWTLPEGQHQAFVLRHWSGLSQDEIADVLDTTPGAVESLLIRARRALVEDQQEAGTECSRVRSRLVQALIPSSAQQAHITSCRRCRTAQSRLLRASEFATAYALVPRPWVAHTLSSAIPGFGSSAAVTTTAAAATGGGAPGSQAAAAPGSRRRRRRPRPRCWQRSPSPRRRPSLRWEPPTRSEARWQTRLQAAGRAPGAQAGDDHTCAGADDRAPSAAGS